MACRIRTFVVSLIIFQSRGVCTLFLSGDLFDYLESCPGRFLEDAEAGPCIAQLLGAISFLHERAVIHGDVKPENMLLEMLAWRPACA